jgi:hypothetical protein
MAEDVVVFANDLQEQCGAQGLTNAAEDEWSEWDCIEYELDEMYTRWNREVLEEDGACWKKGGRCRTQMVMIV